MVSHEKAVLTNSKIGANASKLIYPPQSLVDLIWRDKPTKSLEKVYTHSIEFTGKDTASKLAKLRDWIKQQPPDKSYPNKVTGPMDVPVAMLVKALNCIGM
jgi:Xaa-Pro aminopeptidase